MPEEKTNAVLRAEIDQTNRELSALRLELKELNAKTDANHRTHNSQFNSLDRQMIVLVGDGNLHEGVVHSHKSAFERVWKNFSDINERIDHQNETTWKLKLALVAGSMGTGGGIVYVLMRFLGA